MDTLLLDRLLTDFLAEDLGQGDVTTEAVFSGGEIARGSFIAREEMIAVGMGRVAARVFQLLDPGVQVESAVEDGLRVRAGDKTLVVRGPVRELLRGERVALNLAQRLCGVATLTAAYVDRVRDLGVEITDTRKTTPGLRLLEKYAVRAGGGRNHRFTLSDGALIKDNHITACGSITEAVRRVRRTLPHTIRIEVEAETLEQVQECLDNRVDIIMLDNMQPADMITAVGQVAGRARVEASGGVSLETVRAIAETGVDIISVGRLTHSAPARDISMEIE
jgi:nicotinate-nucleotide pyrophosphorylase (carboxylating)